MPFINLEYLETSDLLTGFVQMGHIHTIWIIR